jgi:hypothetical protein
LPRLPRQILLLLTAVSLATGCATAMGSPTQTVCGGISSQAGGCDPNRHIFVESTCDDLAREWATVVDGRIVGIIDGPEDVGGEARSVRLKQAVVGATIDVNGRMRALDIRVDCNAEAFLDVAEAELSPSLKAGVGSVMYDGDPVVGYQEWLADVERSVRMIDQEE